jgi:hypothetical protein
MRRATIVSGRRDRADRDVDAVARHVGQAVADLELERRRGCRLASPARLGSSWYCAITVLAATRTAARLAGAAANSPPARRACRCARQ